MVNQRGKGGQDKRKKSERRKVFFHFDGTLSGLAKQEELRRARKTNGVYMLYTLEDHLGCNKIW